MPHETGITCDHQHADGKDGLCPACLEEYEIDPFAWIEFGEHPAGHANYQALLDEIAADRPAIEPPPEEQPGPFDDSEIPF